MAISRAKIGLPSFRSWDRTLPFFSPFLCGACRPCAKKSTRAGSARVRVLGLSARRPCRVSMSSARIRRRHVVVGKRHLRRWLRELGRHGSHPALALRAVRWPPKASPAGRANPASSSGVASPVWLFSRQWRPEILSLLCLVRLGARASRSLRSRLSPLPSQLEESLL